MRERSVHSYSNGSRVHFPKHHEPSIERSLATGADKMLNVIIPLAGTGSRFLSGGYWRPKPFIKALGKELIAWLVESLSLCATDVVVLVFNQNPEIGLSPVNFFDLLEDSFSKLRVRPSVIYTSIDKPTVGAAETVLHGIDSLPESRLLAPCVLLDGDTFYTVEILANYRNERTQTRLHI